MKNGEKYTNVTRVTTLTQSEKIKYFKSILDDLSGIAYQDALKYTSDEDRLFLFLQRQRGRIGCIARVDSIFFYKQKNGQQKKSSRDYRTRKF